LFVFDPYISYIVSQHHSGGLVPLFVRLCLFHTRIWRLRLCISSVLSIFPCHLLLLHVHYYHVYQTDICAFRASVAGGTGTSHLQKKTSMRSSLYNHRSNCNISKTNINVLWLYNIPLPFCSALFRSVPPWSLFFSLPSGSTSKYLSYLLQHITWRSSRQASHVVVAVNENSKSNVFPDFSHRFFNLLAKQVAGRCMT
jgi:hypothetical protein